MLSPYLIAIVVAWVVAQGGKFLIASIGHRGRMDLRQLYLSGDMPSAHTAAVVALVTVIGLAQGTKSSTFAIAALFAAIVMYDAVMVRRSTGEQGAAIESLIRERKSDVRVPRAAKGHEPLEVVAGACVGLLVGALVYFVTQ